MAADVERSAQMADLQYEIFSLHSVYIAGIFLFCKALLCDTMIPNFLRLAMYTIVNLFGRSPFTPLQTHMDKVSRCVHLLPDLFVALEKKERAKMEAIAEEISTVEHEADLTKNDIRNHLPKSLYLPIDRGNLLDILSMQDSIADRAEDVAVLVTLAPLELLESFRSEFLQFLHSNIASYDLVLEVIREMHELLEASLEATRQKRSGKWSKKWP